MWIELFHPLLKFKLGSKTKQICPKKNQKQNPLSYKGICSLPGLPSTDALEWWGGSPPPFHFKPPPLPPPALLPLSLPCLLNHMARERPIREENI